MSSHKDILAMLAACAPGHIVSLKTHNYFVLYNKLTYCAYRKLHSSVFNPM
jgi:hypothetical protein